MEHHTSQPVVVFVTVPDKDVADKIAVGAVEASLCACCTIIEGVESVFFWDGRVSSSNEMQLILKTTSDRIDALMNFVISSHPYRVPEFLVIPVVNGYAPYLEWISTATSERNK